MIIHVDMDAFYASVEINQNPSLADKPVVVGGNGKRGVVSAANYIARRFGIHSAMPIGTAKKLCIDLIILPVHMSLYASISRKINEIFLHYTPLVEPLSLDEAFLDPQGSEKLFGDAESIACKIKHSIKDELNLVASVGIAPNKFIAKIASDLEKPDGFVSVKENEIHDFLDPLPIAKLWGVGQVTRRKLNKIGIFTIGQIREFDIEDLQTLFGTVGTHFWRLANGIDTRQVVPTHRAKSISHERTFDIDVSDLNILVGCLMDLTELVCWRLRNNNLYGRTIHLKIRFSNFKTITRSETLHLSTNATGTIWHIIEKLILKLPRTQAVRLIGVGISELNTGEDQQLDLFSADITKNQELDRLVDKINGRFGPSALRRALRLKKNKMQF